MSVSGSPPLSAEGPAISAVVLIRRRMGEPLTAGVCHLVFPCLDLFLQSIRLPPRCCDLLLQVASCGCRCSRCRGRTSIDAAIRRHEAASCGTNADGQHSEAVGLRVHVQCVEDRRRSDGGGSGSQRIEGTGRRIQAVAGEGDGSVDNEDRACAGADRQKFQHQVMDERKERAQLSDDRSLEVLYVNVDSQEDVH